MSQRAIRKAERIIVLTGKTRGVKQEFIAVYEPAKPRRRTGRAVVTRRHRKNPMSKYSVEEKHDYQNITCICDGQKLVCRKVTVERKVYKHNPFTGTKTLVA